MVTNTGTRSKSRHQETLAEMKAMWIRETKHEDFHGMIIRNLSDNGSRDGRRRLNLLRRGVAGDELSMTELRDSVFRRYHDAVWGGDEFVTREFSKDYQNPILKHGMRESLLDSLSNMLRKIGLAGFETLAMPADNHTLRRRAMKSKKSKTSASKKANAVTTAKAVSNGRVPNATDQYSTTKDAPRQPGKDKKIRDEGNSRAKPGIVTKPPPTTAHTMRQAHIPDILEDSATAMNAEDMERATLAPLREERDIGNLRRPFTQAAVSTVSGQAAEMPAGETLPQPSNNKKAVMISEPDSERRANAFKNLLDSFKTPQHPADRARVSDVSALTAEPSILQPVSSPEDVSLLDNTTAGIRQAMRGAIIRNSTDAVSSSSATPLAPTVFEDPVETMVKNATRCLHTVYKELFPFGCRQNFMQTGEQEGWLDRAAESA